MTYLKALKAIGALTLLGVASSAPTQTPPRQHVITMRNMSYGRMPVLERGHVSVEIDRLCDQANQIRGPHADKKRVA